MSSEEQSLIDLQGVTPFVSLRRRGGKTTNNNYSVICWNKIVTIFG